MLGFHTEAESKPKRVTYTERVGRRPARGLRSERRLLPVVNGPLAGTSQEVTRMNNRFSVNGGVSYRQSFMTDEEGRTRHFWTR
jgi:hypothetical protein